MAVVTTQFLCGSDRERRMTGVLNALYEQGAGLGWGDVHFESQEDGSVIVRARQDGVMIEVERFQDHEATILINKFRYRANLDVSDTRHEQDGRFVQECHGRRIDVRLNIVPTIFGYSIVTRLLDSENSGMPIERLGMSRLVEQAFRDALQQSEGLILTGGPTGSGKTTTLYAALNLLNTPDRKVMTAEDPVEYIQKGIQQIPVGDGTGRTFASAIRAMMRQNPNTILVGEIRDEETGQAAIRASLTGHLVLATIHANSGIETLYRLEDLGVSPRLVANSVRLILGQRLLRQVCPACAEDRPVKDAELFHRWGVEPPETEKVGPGCSACHGTGYKGRQAIYEAVVMTRQLRSAINVGAGKNDLEEILKKQPQYRKLFASACDLVAAGVTNTAEILKVLSDAED